MESWQVDAENGSGQMMPKGLRHGKFLLPFPLAYVATLIQQTNKQKRVHHQV